MVAYFLAASALGACYAGYAAHRAKFPWPWLVFTVVLIVELGCGYVMGVWR